MDSSSIERYLKILLLDSHNTISVADIETNYKKLVKIYHPDTCIDAYKDGKMFIEITNAKDYLINNINSVNEYIRNKNFNSKTTRNTTNNSNSQSYSKTNEYTTRHDKVNETRKNLILDIRAINDLAKNRIITINSVRAFVHEKVKLLNDTFKIISKPWAAIIVSFVAFALFFIASCTAIVASRDYGWYGWYTFMDITSGTLGLVAILTGVNMILSLILKDLKIIKKLYYFSSAYLLLPVINLVFPMEFIRDPGDYNANIFAIIFLLIITIFSYGFVFKKLKDSSSKSDLTISEYGYYTIEIENLYTEGLISLVDYEMLKNTLSTLKL